MFPELSYTDWHESKITLHLMSQIIGKIRMNLHPKLNHWWHVVLYVNAQGLTTGPIPYKDFLFEMVMDFINHQCNVTCSTGSIAKIDLTNISVAEFYNKLMSTLKSMDIDVSISLKPFDSKKVGSDIPYPDDTQHTYSDRTAIQNFWHSLTLLYPIYEEFTGRFQGKTSPANFYWHSFDYVITRFSGKLAHLETNDPVAKEAYSHEAISFGFWPGDDTFQEAAFYSYTYPEPKSLAEEPIKPSQAFWHPVNSSHLAILKYADLIKLPNPKKSLLDFLESTFTAGASLAKW